MVGCLFFITCRLDPVEYVEVSQQRNGNVLNVKPSAVLGLLRMKAAIIGPPVVIQDPAHSFDIMLRTELVDSI